MEAVLLGAAAGADQGVEAAAGVRVEEDVEEGDVARLGRPDRLGGELEEGAGGARCGRCGGPRWRRSGRPSARPSAPTRARRAAPAGPSGRAGRGPVRGRRAPAARSPSRGRGPARARASVRWPVKEATLPPSSTRWRPSSWVGKVSTPSSSARAAIRRWVGPIHWPPISTTLPSPSSSFSTRPPTRSRASITSGRAPAAATCRAATRPASPAPTTATSASISLDMVLPVSLRLVAVGRSGPRSAVVLHSPTLTERTSIEGTVVLLPIGRLAKPARDRRGHRHPAPIARGVAR